MPRSRRARDKLKAPRPTNMVRGCHICETGADPAARADSDSGGSVDDAPIAVTPDEDARIDVGASIASLRNEPIVDDAASSDSTGDGWGVPRIDLGASIASLRDVPIVDDASSDDTGDGWGVPDLGASVASLLATAEVDDRSARAVVEVVARAITGYGRRCRAEHLPGHDAWATALRLRCASALGITEHARGDGLDGDYVLLDATPCAHSPVVDPQVAERLLGSIIRSESAVAPYDARVRAVLKDACRACRASWAAVAASEKLPRRPVSFEEPPRRRSSVSVRDATKVAATAVGGGALLAGAGALTVAAAPVVVVSLVAGSLGCAGAGITGLKARRRFVADDDFRTVERSRGAGAPRFFLVPGWLAAGRDDDDAFSAAAPRAAHVEVNDAAWADLVREDALELASCDWFREVFPLSDGAVVVWEKNCLRRLKAAMDECTVYATAKSKVGKVLIDETIKRSALGGLAATAQLPLSALSYVRRVDDPWAVAVGRARGAGKRLAEALLDERRGTTPAILVGYGVGARVVMEALECLAAIAVDARRQAPARRQRAASRVECAVLLGAPVSATSERWRAARGVVSGRLINGYSTRDWMLRLVYRSKAWSIAGVAGSTPVVPEHSGQDAPCVENVDLSDLVNGHLSYAHVMEPIFARLRLEG